MKLQRFFITDLLVFPLFNLLLFFLMVSSWTIEKFQLKKDVPINKKEVNKSS
jgi:hypothetical protein